MLLIILLLMWNLGSLGSVYRIFKKKHLLFDDRFTMTMCMAITLVSSFVIALHLEILLPASVRAYHLIPISVGLVVGWKFGAFIKAPASLNGIYNGLMGGIMGTMFGAVLQNPALCNIPVESEAMIITNMYTLAIFTTCLHVLTSRIIRSSFKG